MVFRDSILSLNILLSWFIHVEVQFHCMDVHFIYTTVDGHLNCFHILAIRNMLLWTCMYKFYMDMFSFLFLNLIIYQGVQLPGHVVNVSGANGVEHLFMCILTYFYFSANSSVMQCALPYYCFDISVLCNPGNQMFKLVQFSCSVVSDSLWPHVPQHARPPCPSPTPGVHPNPCPLSQWSHPTISSSVIPFSHPQSFPASGSFPVSQLFTWGGQSIGVSASTSVLPMNTQDWSPLGWTGWISFQSKGLWRVFSNTTVQKHTFFWAQLLL